MSCNENSKEREVKKDHQKSAKE